MAFKSEKYEFNFAKVIWVKPIELERERKIFHLILQIKPFFFPIADCHFPISTYALCTGLNPPCTQMPYQSLVASWDREMFLQIRQYNRSRQSVFTTWVFHWILFRFILGNYFILFSYLSVLALFAAKKLLNFSFVSSVRCQSRISLASVMKI